MSETHKPPVPSGYERYLNRSKPISTCGQREQLMRLPATNITGPIPVLIASECRPVSKDELARMSPFHMNFRKP